MSTQHNGKRIKTVFWPDTEAEQGSRLVAGTESCEELVLENFFRGDHDEDWILQLSGGNEVARFNPRFVEGFVWAESNDT